MTLNFEALCSKKFLSCNCLKGMVYLVKAEHLQAFSFITLSMFSINRISKIRVPEMVPPYNSKRHASASFVLL